MSFLAFDIFQLIKDGIGYAVQAGIRTIFYEICSFIYGLIINIYDVFNALCNAQLLDIEIIKDISQRVGLVLGLIMFFMVSFSFIQMVLDPEKMTDKEMGAANIVKKVLIVIVMFGISPFIFDTLQTVQDNVISNNVLNRILLPNNYDVDSESFGKVISLNLFTSFYYLDEYKTENGADSTDYDNCSTDYNYLQNSVLSDGDFSSSCVTTPVNYTDENGNERFGFIMNFNYILSLVVGIFVCYCLIMYTISVGIRVVQLAFLQMISPMAFIAYLTPKKDNLFSKWLKMYAMTFLDVFIRIAIISLGVFLISIILDSWDDVMATGDGFGSVFWHSVATCDANGENCEVSGVLYIKIIMILAILSFMKKAPELIKQLFPEGSGSGIGFGVKNEGANAFVGGLTGAAVGAVGGVAGGKGLSRLTGLVGGIGFGALRGGKAGFGSKDIGSAVSGATSSQSKANLSRAQAIASGKGWRERAEDAVRGTLGVVSGYDKLNQELSMSNDIKTTLKDEDVVKHINEVRQSYLNNLRPGQSADAEVLKKFDAAEKSALRQMYHHAYASDSGSNNIHINQIVDEHGNVIMGSFDEEFVSNRGIYNQIHANEKRAGIVLDTYDGKDINGNDINGSNGGWKADNVKLKNKIADTHKKS